MSDVFISHASEDKEQIARPLAEELSKRGLSVWYDEFSLELGDSLRRSIDKGLAQSRFGVVILSENFFAKEWPQRELDGLSTRETSGGEKVILPLWHGVTHAEVLAYSPVLADRVAFNTRRGVSAAADEIEAVVQRQRKAVPPQAAASNIPSEIRGLAEDKVDHRTPTATEKWTGSIGRNGLKGISLIVLFAIIGAVIQTGGQFGNRESPIPAMSSEDEAPRSDSLAERQDPAKPTTGAEGSGTAALSPATEAGEEKPQVSDGVPSEEQALPTTSAPLTNDARIQQNSRITSAVPRSITEIVFTDGKAVYYDPQYDIPGACPAGGEVVFNGGGGMPGAEAVPCENGKLVFRPLALTRWSDRINPNTGHCLAFRPRGGHPAYPSRQLTGADGILTQEGLIGFRIDVSVQNPQDPRIVLTSAPGRNGTNPCYV
jgi:hypothetical protein